MERDLNSRAFERRMNLTVEELCRNLFFENRETIKINKEQVAVKNLVKIVNAALKLSNRSGFAAMTLRQLSKEAGLSMGALYAYFTNKSQLLRIMQQHGSQVVMRVLRDHVDGIDDPRVRLRRAIYAHLYVSEVMQSWFYFSYMETKNFPKEESRKAIESELSTERMFTDIIEEGQAMGLFRPVQTELVGAAIKAMLQDWYLKRWKYARRKVSVDQYGEFLVDFAESYLISEAS